MRYTKSLEIEQRLATALSLIESGQYSTPMLAKELGVSIPTISRIVAALRERGHDIKSERRVDGWRYVIEQRVESNRRISRSAVRSHDLPK